MTFLSWLEILVFLAWSKGWFGRRKSRLAAHIRHDPTYLALAQAETDT